MLMHKASFCGVYCNDKMLEIKSVGLEKLQLTGKIIILPLHPQYYNIRTVIWGGMIMMYQRQYDMAQPYMG